MAYPGNADRRERLGTVSPNFDGKVKKVFINAKLQC